MKLRYLILVVAVGLLVLGFMQLRSMPVDVLPEFNPPLIEIQTEALGLSAEEVESLITVPLEADLLNGVAFLESITSKSITGLSSILLVFEPGTDIIRARQLVQERLTQAHALPNVSKPPTMLQPLSSTNRVMMVGLSSDNLSLIDQSVLARWNIKPKLMGVPGVANVSIWGQRKRQLQVLVNPETLRANEVTLNQVISTAGNSLWVSPLSYLNASYPGTGGWIETPNQRLGIRHLLPITTPEDLGQVTVEGAETLRLSEVATIVENHQPLIGDALINDQSGLLLLIEKFPEASPVEVTQGVEEAIANMAPGLAGIEFDTNIFKPATYIQSTNTTLRTVIGLSAALVAVALFVFLFSWRSALVGFAVMPLSMLSALLVLYYRGATFNVMVLAGLVVALAAVIDDAVLSVENIKRRLKQVKDDGNGVPVAKVILDATLEVRKPMLFATLILLVAVVPVLALTGLAGAFFSPLALSYALAVVASTLVALIVTPALSLMLFARRPESSVAEAPALSDSSLAAGLQGFVSRGMIAKPLVAVVGGAVLVVLALIVLPQLRQDALLPDFKVPNVLIRWTGEPGASRAFMVEKAAEATAELRALPGVSNVAAHIGRAVTSDEVTDVNAGELWVRLASDANHSATHESIRNVLSAYPELAQGTTTHLQEVTEAAKPAPNNTLTVRVYGDNLDDLKTKADEVSGVVAGVSGVTNARVESMVEKPTLEVEVDLGRAEQYGLKPGDVRRAAAALLSGIEVGNLFEDQKVFDVVVWGAPEIRQDVESVEALLIDAPVGGQVRLDQVASVDVVPTFDSVFRQGVSRYLDVVATVSGRGLSAVATDVESGLRGVDWPLEFHAALLDDYAERLRAQRSFLSFLIAAVIGIFLLQQAAFRSWRSATAAFLGLLVAVSGAAIFALLAGGSLSIAVIAGMLAVLALAARNGIMLIHHYQQLQFRNGGEPDADFIVQASKEKVVPILISTVALLAALVPVLLFGSRPGLEVIAPMALVMVGGLITSAFANLVVIPALYLRFKADPEEEFDFGPTEAWLPLGTADATD